MSKRDLEKALEKARSRISELENRLHSSDISRAENKYRTLFENTGTPVCVLKEDGLIVACNKVFSEFFGYPKSEIDGSLHWTALVPPQELDRVSGYTHARLSGDESAPSVYNSEVLLKDGSIRTVICSVGMIPDSDERVVSLIDISERLAEDKRKLEQSQIESAIIGQSPVGISVRDRNGNLLLCNGKWAEIWNKPEEDVQALLDRKQDELALDNRDSYLGAYKEDVVKIYTEGGDLTVPDLYIKSLDKWLTQRFYGIINPSGDIGKVVVLTEDITEEKRARSAEEALKRSDEKYETLVNNLPVAVFKSGMDGHLFSVNSTMLSMFSADSEKKLLNTRVEDLYLDSTDRMTFKESLSQSGQLDNYHSGHRSPLTESRIARARSRP